MGSIPQYNAGMGIIHVGPVPTGCDPPPPPTEDDLVAAIIAANATATPTIVFPANHTEAPRDITIQYSFFAGNTRGMVIKANNSAT